MKPIQIQDLLVQTPGIEVLVALVSLDPFTLNPPDRVDYLAALERQSGWLQSLLQIAIVAVAGAEAALDRGRYSSVDDPAREEIASTLNLAPVTAQSRIDVARVLTQHLPATCAALSNGEISSAQATVIARESATLIRRGIHPVQLRYLESTAIAYSEFHTPAQVTNKVRSMVAKMEPEEFEVEAAEAVQERRVTLTAQPHGMAQILALLPAAEAQTIWLAIDKLARSQRDQSLVTTLGKETLPEFITEKLEPLTLDQLRADALATIAAQFLSITSEENLAHGRAVTLNLTLDLPTLLGLKENPGLLAGYGEIPASVARQFLEISSIMDEVPMNPHNFSLTLSSRAIVAAGSQVAERQLESAISTMPFPGRKVAKLQGRTWVYSVDVTTG
jgi:hypothetical protein